MRILSEPGDIKARMAAAVARENMEEGELSSGSDDGGGLGGYTPLERPVNLNLTSSPRHRHRVSLFSY